MDPKYDKKIFAQWVRVSRELLGFSEQELADKLGLSVSTTILWEIGIHSWAVLPDNTKQKIIEVLGVFPPPKVESRIEFRQSTTYMQENELSDSIEENYPDSICSKCSNPIRIKDNGRCSNCHRAADNSQ